MTPAPAFRAIRVKLRAASAGCLAALLVLAPAAAQTPSGLRGRTDLVRPDACKPDGKSCFTLLAVTLDGAVAIDPAELAGVYSDYLVQPVSIKDLARIATHITDRYVKAGYFLSQAIVPPQDLATGVVRLTVLEGRIVKVTIKGLGAEQVRPLFTGLDQQPIARLDDLDHRLALANDIPGFKVTSQIVPDPENPTEHELIVETQVNRSEAYAEVSNRGSKTAGPWQVFGQASLNSLFSLGDQLTLSAMTVPGNPRDFAYIGADYRQALGDGSELSLSLSGSKAQDGHNVFSPAIGGDTLTGSVGYEIPLFRRRKSGLWLGAELDASHLENDWSSGGGYRDELRVAKVTLRGYQSESGQSSTIFLQTSFGLDILGASGPSSLNRSRYDADASFSKLNLYASHYRALGGNFSLFAAIAGQLSSDRLLLSEQFSVGGASLGRAYGYGELQGDQGIGGSLELRADFDSPFKPITFLEGYAFYDIARVWTNDAVSDLKAPDLSSAGVGLRFDIYDWLSARMEVAKPLTRTPSDQDNRNWRQFFTLSTAY